MLKKMPADKRRKIIWRQNYKTKIRKLIREAKNKPCVDCGERYPYYVMEFDHVRGTKLGNITFSVCNTANRLKAEIAKCDLVCANCHKVRTHERRKRG